MKRIMAAKDGLRGLAALPPTAVTRARVSDVFEFPDSSAEATFAQIGSSGLADKAVGIVRIMQVIILSARA
jgi:hypothetical protein